MNENPAPAVDGRPESAPEAGPASDACLRSNDDRTTRHLVVDHRPVPFGGNHRDRIAPVGGCPGGQRTQHGPRTSQFPIAGRRGASALTDLTRAEQHEHSRQNSNQL
ncbi:hypothetical protein [Halobellus inordinatus]|uniref:hypothetical protein n=1 Tax=Halobellus inordinatus TaxID=1126236 RepID=UPI00210E349A|nr:hypothetical protein [Halobellus inordinatus]